MDLRRPRPLAARLLKSGSFGGRGRPDAAAKPTGGGRGSSDAVEEGIANRV
jgi:hypothetical protein